MKKTIFPFLFCLCFNLWGQTEQLLVNENFQGWGASGVNTTETSFTTTSLYGEAITYTWKNCAVMPAQDPKNSNGVASTGAIQTAKVADHYFEVSGFASVTRAIFKHAYTGSARGCTISVKGDGDSDWVVLFSENTTSASGQETELSINRTHVSLRFQGNNTGQNAYLHDLLIYGNTNQVVPTLQSINYLNGDLIPDAAGEFVLTFSEPVTRGTGAITLGEQEILAENIIVEGAVVSIKYSALATDSQFQLVVPAGSFVNSIGTPTSSDFSYRYRTKDTVLPVLIENTILEGGTYPVSGFFSLLMSENCKAGLESISLGTKSISAATSGSNGNLIYLNYSGLAYDTDYTILIPSGAIVDQSGNSYVGTSFTFHTEMEVKGDPLVHFIPDAITVPSTTSGLFSLTLNGIQLDFTGVSNPGVRNADVYSYAFKCNSVQLTNLNSVGSFNFYIQSGGGSVAQKYYIQKLGVDGESWTTIETFILGTNDRTKISSSAAQSSVPSTLRLMASEAPLWFYDVEVSDFAQKEVIDNGVNPHVISSLPAQSAIDLPINGVIKLTFNESIQLGSGSIMLTGVDLNGDGIVDEKDGLAMTPTVLGGGVTIPYTNLWYETTYTLNVPAGVFKDLFGNNSEAFSLIFSTKAKPAVVPTLFSFVVAKDGSGDGTTIQSAFDAVPLNNASPFLIFVKEGVYQEYPTLAATKNNVSLIGQGCDQVFIKGNRRSGIDGFTTSTCQTVAILATNFYAENVTIENSAGVDAGQAVALKVYADRAVFKNVKLVGYQDTHLTSNVATDRQYYQNCEIRGSVDFIFGDGIAYFDHSLIYIQDRATANVIVAPSTSIGNRFGYVFNQCTIDGASSQDGKFHLGRPWKNSPQTVYLNTQMNILPAEGGWTNMSSLPKQFAEYGSVNGSNYPVDLSKRNTLFSYTENNIVYSGTTPSAVLSEIEAANYSLKTVLGGADSWNATLKTETTATPTHLRLTGNELSWNPVDGAICYVVLIDNKVSQLTTSTAFLAVTGTYKVVAVSEFGALSAPSEDILVDDVTGVSEFKAELPSLKSTLIDQTIEFTHLEQIRSIAIFSLSGELIIETDNRSISADRLHSGCYLVRLTLVDGRQLTTKVIKCRE